jgi:hypothetical protein
MAATWVQAESGAWINLDLCRRIEPWQRKVGPDRIGPARKELYWRIETAEGTFDAVHERSLDPDSLSRRFVSASPGAAVFLVSVQEHFTKPEPRPSADDLYIEEVGVAAWAISRGLDAEKFVARPVLMREWATNDTVLLVQADGAVLDVFNDERHDTFDAAKSQLLQRAQESWDREARSSEASDTP